MVAVANGGCDVLVDGRVLHSLSKYKIRLSFPVNNHRIKRRAGGREELLKLLILS